MPQKLFIALAAALLLTASTADARSTVNKSLRVDSGETVTDELSSVNGSVTVGEAAQLQDEASTVNGSLTIGDNTSTRDLSSVNGTLDIGDGVSVDGDASTVNGTVRVGQSTVSGDVETVNGSIKLKGATVERNVTTVNGRVVLDYKARVHGDVIVKETRGRNNWRGTLKIELLGGSSVDGDIIVEDEDRSVEVIIRDGSSVGGQIKGAEITRD